MPKSASTSLMATLGAASGLPARQDMFPDNAWPPYTDFRVLPRFHSDARELTRDQVRVFGSRSLINKQHVLPTRNNLDLLQRQGKSSVLLLTRDPLDIVHAYRRNDRLLGVTRVEFQGCNTSDEWLERAEHIGLIDELALFKRRWEEVASYVVTYEQLMNQTTVALGIARDALGLSFSLDGIDLQRLRWSRGNRVDYRTASSKSKSMHVRMAQTLNMALKPFSLEIRRRPRM